MILQNLQNNILLKTAIKRKNILLLIFILAIYFSFGLYHLSKFETVDEHFWKYERIPQYWKDGILKGNFKETYINDKPGISVAFVSGIGLLFYPDPENHRIKDKEITHDNLFTVYNIRETEKINISLRLPILIFNSLFIFYFFWIIKRITNSSTTALFSVALIYLSPILIGISQIINPDSLLWMFFFAAIFSYIALLKTKERKFVFLATIFTGLGLLSKYTANILFPAYLMLTYLNLFFHYEKYAKNIKGYLSEKTKNLIIIFLGSCFIFCLFMPAALMQIKLLYQSTLSSPAMEKTGILIAVFILAQLFDIFALDGRLTRITANFFHKKGVIINKFIVILLLIILFFTLINSWSGEKFIQLENLKENSYTEGVLDFPFLKNKPLIEKYFQQLAIQAYPVFYTVTPVLLIPLLFLWIKTLFSKIRENEFLVFFFSLFFLIYLIGAIASGVFITPRYAIIIYPIFAFLSSIGIYEIIKTLEKSKFYKKFFIAFLLLIIFCGSIFSLWKTKPFYLSYTNSFLPQDQVVSDPWGYGQYEAAQYLNNLPESEKIIIWSDWSGICQFFKGLCIKDYKIDLEKTKPDYFVITRRGSIRRPFKWKNPDLAKKENIYYYSEDINPVWQLNIVGRPDNFIKIIRSEE